jgi:hypothetical protein
MQSESPIPSARFQHPADGYYMIEPYGEHPNGKMVQKLDPEAGKSIEGTFKAKAGDKNFAGMLIDREHQKHLEAGDSSAAGWLMDVQARADGLYGKIRWTRTGQAAVDGGEYRFFSTEYDKSDMQEVSPGIFRPLRLAGLTLTNVPNNRGGKPITNTRTTAGKGPCISIQDQKLALRRTALMPFALLTTLPDLISKSKGRLYNRLPDQSSGRGQYDVTDAEFGEAEDRANEVLQDLQAAVDHPGVCGDRGDRISEYTLPCAFLSALRMLIETGVAPDLKSAFEHLKSTEPIFWTRGVLSYSPDDPPVPKKISLLTPIRFTDKTKGAVANRKLNLGAWPTEGQRAARDEVSKLVNRL